MTWCWAPNGDVTSTAHTCVAAYLCGARLVEELNPVRRLAEPSDQYTYGAPAYRKRMMEELGHWRENAERMMGWR